LLLDPERRVTAAEALALPYFSEFREPDEETEAQLYDHSLDNAELTLDQWKRKKKGEERKGLMRSCTDQYIRKPIKSVLRM